MPPLWRGAFGMPGMAQRLQPLSNGRSEYSLFARPARRRAAQERSQSDALPRTKSKPRKESEDLELLPLRALAPLALDALLLPLLQGTVVAFRIAG